MSPCVVLVNCMIGEVWQSQWESVVLFTKVGMEKSRVLKMTYPCNVFENSKFVFDRNDVVGPC
jgi:hypothetical protein